MARVLTVSAARDLLIDAFDRIGDGVEGLLDGLDDGALTHRVAPDANTIGWLVWHLLRVQDDHVADAAGTDQVWTGDGWADRFGLPFPTTATGYGQTPDDVAAVRVSSALLLGYSEAVHAATVRFLDGLVDADLARVVDDAWVPPVTLGVRLVSVVGDDLKHLGQAEYLKGLR